MNGPDRALRRRLLADALVRSACARAARGDPNRPLLASLIAGRMTGAGCLPDDLGLGPARCRQLLERYFTGPAALDPRPVPARIPEWEDLRKLLLDHRAGEHESEAWMADIIATGCAGADHLWQDLGLADRAELTALMQLNFPALARANTGDMKWKKFLYRQFCAREGIYVCPAPSCGVCVDYARCFAPEH